MISRILYRMDSSLTLTNQGLYCSAYNTSKAACHQLCRSLAVEWGQYKIRVNTISPGYIRTAMTNMLLQDKPEILDRWENDNPLGRIAWPNELKGPAIYLLSKASSFVTGSDIKVDGGVSIILISRDLSVDTSVLFTALRLVDGVCCQDRVEAEILDRVNIFQVKIVEPVSLAMCLMTEVVLVPSVNLQELSKIRPESPMSNGDTHKQTTLAI
jgi:hypothetical protein